MRAKMSAAPAGANPMMTRIGFVGNDCARASPGRSPQCGHEKRGSRGWEISHRWLRPVHVALCSCDDKD
jgi:hypothetical protein